MAASQNANLIQQMGVFIPNTVMRYIGQHVRDPDENSFAPPLKQQFDAVALFADVSGFTKLSEMLAKKGPIGAEELGFYLNRYLEKMVKIINRSGGDVLKFAGDAMLVLWPAPEKNHGKSRDDLLSEMVHRATQCCLDIQEEVRNVKMAKNVTLNVKLGIGVGACTIMHVGGVYGRLEYLAAGAPLVQAFLSEKTSVAGDVILSPEAWAFAKNFFEAEHREDPPITAGFARVVRKLQGIRNVSLKGYAGRLNGFEEHIRRYIPAAIVPFLEINEKRWTGELRHVTVIFVNLGIRGSKLDHVDAKILNEIHEIVRAVQQSVYFYEGSLNKFLVDDKGSTLVSVFGLPPLAHENDPVRAVLACLKMRRRVQELGISCSVGITSGLAFCGIVGSSGTRREYTVLGDVVNLSARLMQTAMTVHRDAGVVVDKDSMSTADSDPRLKFDALEPIKVKGKSQPVPIFVPRYEPYFPDYHVPAPVPYTVGRASILSLLASLTQRMVKTKQGSVVLLLGEGGMGKSHVMRDATFVIESTIQPFWGVGEAFHTQHFFAFRQIMRPMMRYLFHLNRAKKQRGDTPENKSADIEADAAMDAARRDSNMSNSAGDHMPVPSESLTEILGMQRPRKSVLFAGVAPSRLLTGLKTMEHEDDGLEQFQDWLATIVARDTPALTPYMSVLDLLLGTRFNEDTPEEKRQLNPKQMGKFVELVVMLLKRTVADTQTSLVLVLDGAHLIAHDDWDVALAVSRAIRNGFLSGVSLWIGSRPLHTAKYQTRFAQTEDEKIPPNYIKLLASEASKVIVLEAWRLEHTLELLSHQYKCTSVDPELAVFVHERCGGVPLFVRKFAELLHVVKGGVTIAGGHASLSEAWLKRMDNIDVDCDVPYRVQRILASHIDRLSPSQEMALKVAASVCVGEGSSQIAFSMEMIRGCHPIHAMLDTLSADLDALVNKLNLLVLLQEGSEARDDSDDGLPRANCDPHGIAHYDSNAKDKGRSSLPGSRIVSSSGPYADFHVPQYRLLSDKDKVYAFKYGFLRDTLYQLMLFKQRKLLHTNIGRFLSAQRTQTHEAAKTLSGGRVQHPIFNKTAVERHRNLANVLGQLRQSSTKASLDGETKMNSRMTTFFTGSTIEEKGFFSKLWGSCCASSTSAEEPETPEKLGKPEKGEKPDTPSQRQVVPPSRKSSGETNDTRGIVPGAVSVKAGGLVINAASRNRLDTEYFNSDDDDEEISPLPSPGPFFRRASHDSSYISDDSFLHRSLPGSPSVSRSPPSSPFNEFVARNALHMPKHSRGNSLLPPGLVSPAHKRERSSPDARVFVSPSKPGPVFFPGDDSNPSTTNSSPYKDSATSSKENIMLNRSVVNVEDADDFEQKDMIGRRVSLILSAPFTVSDYLPLSTGLSPVEAESYAHPYQIHEDLIAITPQKRVVQEEKKDNETDAGEQQKRSLCAIPVETLQTLCVNVSRDSSLSSYASSGPRRWHGVIPVESDSDSEIDDTKENRPLVKSPLEEKLQSLLLTIGDWDFDIFQLNELSERRPLFAMGFTFCKVLGLDRTFGINNRRLSRFLAGMEDGYNSKNNAYHNSLHVADVLQSSFSMLRQMDVRHIVSDLDVLALFVACVVHDYRHPGLTNQFFVASQEERSILFNDVRVLENYHCTAAFRFMHEERNNILSGLSRDDQQKVRRKVITLVLGTNLAEQTTFRATMEARVASSLNDQKQRGGTFPRMIHSVMNSIRSHKGEKREEEKVSGAQTVKARGVGRRTAGEVLTMKSGPKELTLPGADADSTLDADLVGDGEVDISAEAQRKPSLTKKCFNDFTKDETNVDLLMQLVIKAADMSNSCKKKYMYQQWADRQMTELFQQGDREKAWDVPPSRFMDRTEPMAKEKCQLLFVDEIVRPTVAMLNYFAPMLCLQCAMNLSSNRKSLLTVLNAPPTPLATKEKAAREILSRPNPRMTVVTPSGAVSTMDRVSGGALSVDPPMVPAPPLSSRDAGGVSPRQRLPPLKLHGRLSEPKAPLELSVPSETK